MTSPWADESDGVLEQRVYYCQNYRGDIASIHKHDGMSLERIHYSAYGASVSLGRAVVY